jgi:hypothetical protein
VVDAPVLAVGASHEEILRDYASLRKRTSAPRFSIPRDRPTTSSSLAREVHREKDGQQEGAAPAAQPQLIPFVDEGS